MKPMEFVIQFYPHAKRCQEKTGISAVAILAQAALESAWGDVAPGNMFFGVKDTDGVNGNEQLLITTEYSRRSDLKFPEIISITPVDRNGVKYFKYRVKDYFRKYHTPEDCFLDHANFFLSNPRYNEALKVSQEPFRFLEEIAKAGYATDPDYASKLKAIASTISNYINLPHL
jgi:flagellar protein FlgJ